jgi:hypothetical protein
MPLPTDFTWLPSTEEKYDEKMGVVPTAGYRRLSAGVVFLMGEAMAHDDRGNGLYQVHSHDRHTGYHVGSRSITGSEFDRL